MGPDIVLGRLDMEPGIAHYMLVPDIGRQMLEQVPGRIGKIVYCRSYSSCLGTEGRRKCYRWLDMLMVQLLPLEHS